MFESSDTEHNATNVPSIMDDNDNSHSSLDYDQLIEKNTTLFKENAILKSQFEQAIQTSNQLQDVNLKNVELLSQIRDLKIENEDLQKRLSLGANTHSQLLEKLNDEKSAKNQLKQEYDQAIQFEIRKTKNIYKTQYDALLDQVKLLQEARENEVIAKKIQASKISKVLDSAKHYFQTDIPDMDALIAQFDANPVHQPVIEMIQETKSKSTNFLKENEKDIENNYKERLKKYKSQLKAAMQTIDDLEAQSQNYKRLFTESEQKLAASATETKDKLAKAREENENNQRESQRVINSLQTKVQQLTEKIEKLKLSKRDLSKYQNQTNLSLKSISSLPQSPESLMSIPISASQAPQTQNQQIPDNSVVNQLNDQITSLNKQIKQEAKKNDRLVKENDELNNDKIHLATSLSQKDNELAALQAVHSESLKEIETLRTALKNLSSDKQKELDKNFRKELKKQRAAFAQIESTLNSTMKQLKDTELERDTNKVEIKKLQNKIQNLEAEILSLKDENNALQTDLADEREKASMKKEVTDEDIMPVSSWSFAEFPNNLQNEISKIARNSALKPPTKLQAVYRLIAQYYEKQIEHREKAINDISKDTDCLKEIANSIIVTASLALTGEAPQANAVLCKATVNNLCQSLNEMPHKISEMQREIQNLHNFVDFVCKEFGIEDKRDLTKMMENIKKFSVAVNTRIKQGEKRAKKLRDVEDKLETIEDENKREKKQLLSEIQEKEDLNKELQKIVDKLNNDIKVLKTEKASLVREKAEAKDHIAELEVEIEHNREQFIEQQQKHEEDVKNAMSNAISSSENLLQQKEDKIANLETKLSQLSSASSSQKVSLDEKVAEVNELKDELEKTKKDAATRLQLEKAALIDSYEKALKTLKEQCDAHRKDVENLSERLATAQETVKKAQISVLQLRKENKSLERENANIKDECDREKRLNETQCQQKIAMTESEVAKKFSDKLTIAEKEKKRLITYIMTELRPFSDSSATIDDKTARVVILQAKGLLAKLMKTDSTIRRMVFATEGQNTDEAVAQALLNGQ